MNTNSKRLGIYLSAMLISTAVAVSLRTAACITQLNHTSGFFTDSGLVSAADAIILLCALGMLSYFFAASRISLYASFSTGATYVPTGILGVATAFLGIKTATYAITTNRYPFFSVETFTLKSPSALLGMLVAILALLSIAHHFLNAFITESKTSIRAYFAVATIAFLAFYSILVYLDGSLSINDSNKILRQMAFIFSAIFFLYETRISLGREKWRVYTVFGLIAASLTAYASIPAIITYYVKGVIISSSNSDSLASIEEYLLLFALFIFILARLCLTATLTEKKENELIKMLDTHARDTEQRVNESFARHQEAFAAKQLSIFDLYGDTEQVSEENADEEAAEAPKESDEVKELTISDDAIYESIFGKMPERPAEADEDTLPEPEDDREPEQIAEDIFSKVDEFLSEERKDSKEEKKI